MADRQINKLYSAILALTILSSDLLASKDSDFQSWNTIITTKKLNSTYSIVNEIHLRLSHSVTEFSQYLIRPSITYKINHENSITAGYTWVYSSKPLAQKNTNEHNIWQQYQVNLKYNVFNLISRSRVEERFIQRNSRTKWTYRQFFNIIKPTNNKIIDFFSVSDEIFYLLNNTLKKSDNRGFNENRLYIGLGKYLEKNYLLQLGYQYQHIRKFRQNNFNANMIVMMLNTDFI